MKPRDYVILAAVLVLAVAAGFVARDLANRSVSASIEQTQPKSEKYIGTVIKEDNSYKIVISSGARSGELLNLVNSSPSLDLSVFEGKNVTVTGFMENNSLIVLAVSEIK